MKTFELIFDFRAIEDIENSLEYYNNIYGNLAVKFKEALTLSLEQIKQNPFYQIKYHDIRILHIKKFPYSIHYLIDEIHDEIHILAVVHTASDPHKTWLRQEE